MHRMPTRKAHSWWWDSHISPKNNKWLADNLEGNDSILCFFDCLCTRYFCHLLGVAIFSTMAIYFSDVSSCILFTLATFSEQAEMDKQVKEMLKLIEDEGDSFAKKAEMYYQRRPLLVTHVENFYRMYRALAERYDNVTGELRKNMPSSLKSQGSGISESDSEAQSTPASPESEKKTSKQKGKKGSDGSIPQKI